MSELVELALETAEEQMAKALDHLESELRKIRAGRAHPSMLESVMVDYYGSMTPLSQVSNVSATDPRTLTVQAWEKSMLDPIAKGITDANLGLNPMNNGEVLIISVPALTEERRRELAKQAKAAGEHAKVGIRTARKDANDEVKSAKEDGLSEDAAKTAESNVQNLTDTFSKQIDERVSKKEADIMTV
jgi:ribosome recycling factor